MQGRKISAAQFLLVLFALVMAWMLATAAQANGQTVNRSCYVERVIDGDTILCRRGKRVRFRVRLAAIDAPEMDQSFGNTSRLQLVGRIERKNIVVRFNPYAPDNFGRFVGSLIDSTGDVNGWLIKTGAAWFENSYAAHVDKATRQTYAQFHATAQSQHLGLWMGDNPMQPSVWRATH